MSRLTRDYKKPKRTSVDLMRLREFAIGVVVGAVLAGSAVLYLTREPAEAQAQADSPKPEPHRKDGARADEPDNGTTADSGESYDFYEMLPKFEVVVPEKEKDVKRDVSAARVDRPGVYVLQAGSYRNQPDAERRASQLRAQGIDAKVQRVAVDNDVWHRVRIGPITDLAEVNRVRSQLHSQDVEALVIRVGD